jgi:hypothetical protein
MPTRGILAVRPIGCYARAASGQAAAPPPSSVMNAFTYGDKTERLNRAHRSA